MMSVFQNQTFNSMGWCHRQGVKCAYSYQCQTRKWNIFIVIWSGWDWRGSHWVWCRHWSCHMCWSWSLICWSVRSRWRRHKVELLLKKLFFAPCTSSYCRRAWLLLDGSLVVQGQLPKEKEKTEVRVREDSKALSWPFSAWQNSRHLVGKSDSVTAVIFGNFWIKNYLRRSQIIWTSLRKFRSICKNVYSAHLAHLVGPIFGLVFVGKSSSAPGCPFPRQPPRCSTATRVWNNQSPNMNSRDGTL